MPTERGKATQPRRNTHAAWPCAAQDLYQNMFWKFLEAGTGIEPVFTDLQSGA